MNSSQSIGGTVLIGPLSIIAQKLTSNPLSSGILTVRSILQNSGIDARQIAVNIDLEDKNEYEVISSATGMILDHKPSIAGFSTSCGFYALTMLITKELKEANDSITIILGGPHASSVWKETLTSCPWIDYIVVGEAELTLSSIWRSLGDDDLMSVQPGLAWRDGGTPRMSAPAPRVQDMDNLPRINWNFSAAGVFAKAKRLEIEAGRGCPYNCVFCSTSAYWGRRFRIKSPLRLISDMKLASEATGTTRFSLVHDLMTTSREWVAEFCSELTAANTPLRWSCSARLDSLDSELMQLMSGAGCYGIFIGLESGSASVQKFIGKCWDMDKALQIVETAVKLNVNLYLSFVLGFPGETPEDLIETIQAALECRRLGGSTVDLIFHTLAPFPDSPLYDDKSQIIELDAFGSYTMEYFTFHAPACTAFVREHPELCTAAYHYRNDEIPRKRVLSMALILISLFRCPATLIALDLLFGDDLAGKLYSFADKVRPEIVGNILALDIMEIEFERFLKAILGEESEKAPWLLDLYRYESVRLCVQVLPERKSRKGLFRDMGFDVSRIAQILLNNRTLPSKDEFTGEYCVWCFNTEDGFRRAQLPRSLGDQLKPPEPGIN